MIFYSRVKIVDARVKNLYSRANPVSDAFSWSCRTNDSLTCMLEMIIPHDGTTLQRIVDDEANVRKLLADLSAAIYSKVWRNPMQGHSFFSFTRSYHIGFGA